MKIDSIDIDASIKNAKSLLEADPDLSPAVRSMVEILLLLVVLLSNRLNLNSKNSSKPPSTDRKGALKKKKDRQTDKKTGGQKGHPGKTLERYVTPDEVKEIPIDYMLVGFENRQVVDILTIRWGTEHKAQVVEDTNGIKFTAHCPEGVTRPIQYGSNIKAHSV